jgi:RNA polymerase sigma factor (sigma-70 family)
MTSSGGRRLESPAMSGRTDSDQKIVEACLAGDDAAWAELVSRYRNLMISVPLRFGLAGDHADEVFQRTCISLLKSLRTIREIPRLAGWISATAANHARMLLREGRGRTDLDPEAVTAGREEDVTVSLRRLEDAQILRAGLERLDARCRALLEALFFSAGDPGYEEIGRRLGMPLGSIGPTRGRCLEKLRKLLRAMGFEE